MPRCRFALALLSLMVSPAWADDPVFSGPQAGEKLLPFKMKGVLGEAADQEIDLLTKADGKPVVLIFVHERTRPSFALTTAIARLAAERSKDGLHCGDCFLSDDATETANWMKRIPQYFTRGVAHGISVDGLEGPGAYGLNRNVGLTILVGKENRVTANFALVQPSVEADGPKVFKAVIDVLGGGEVPDLAKYTRRPGQRPAARMKGHPQLIGLLRSLINREATAEEVAKTAAKIDKLVAEDEAARKELARITHTVVSSGKLEKYGTEPAREQLKKWAEKYGKKSERGNDE